MSLPDRLDGPFWGPYAQFAEAVARSLGIDLTIDHAARNDRFDYLARLRQSLSGPEKPDYVAAFPYIGATPVLMEETAKSGTALVTLNSDLGHDDRKAVGYPRERYKNWVLQSLADDEDAGFQLAQAVSRAARSRFSLAGGETVRLSAIGGNQLAASSLYRRGGLERFIRKSDGQVALNQFVFTDWNYERGREVADGLLRRYEPTHAIWSASLPLGLAAVDAWKATTGGRTAPAIGTVSGPFDDRVLDGIADGSFSTAVGGHFLEGGILLVVLFDHFNGIDFVDDIGTALRVPFQVIEQGNVEGMRAVLGNREWNGDYRHLSKCLNAGLSYYDFSFPSVLRR